MEKDRYYFSCDDSGWGGDSSSPTRWPLPKDNEPGDWRYAGASPFSCIHLRTLKGLLLRRELNFLLFRVQYTGHQVVPRLPSKDDSQYVETGDIYVREACLLYKVKGWKQSTALEFACCCTERAFSSALGNPTGSCYKALDFARRMRKRYAKIEEWATVKGHEFKYENSSVWINLILKYKEETGEEILLSVDEVNEVEETEKQLSKEIECGEVDPYAGKAAIALGNLYVPHHAANHAAKNACHAKNRVAWSKHGAFQLKNASASKLEEATLAMNNAWIKELDWQAEYLASLINDTEDRSSYF